MRNSGMHCFNGSTRKGNFILNFTVLDHGNELDTKAIKLIFDI